MLTRMKYLCSPSCTIAQNCEFQVCVCVCVNVLMQLPTLHLPFFLVPSLWIKINWWKNPSALSFSFSLSHSKLHLHTITLEHRNSRKAFLFSGILLYDISSSLSLVSRLFIIHTTFQVHAGTTVSFVLFTPSLVSADPRFASSFRAPRKQRPSDNRRYSRERGRCWRRIRNWEKGWFCIHIFTWQENTISHTLIDTNNSFLVINIEMLSRCVDRFHSRMM